MKIQYFWKWILTKDVCGLYTNEYRSNVNFVDEKKKKTEKILAWVKPWLTRINQLRRSKTFTCDYLN